MIHIVIRGKDGSGKTTIARLIEKVLHEADVTCENKDDGCWAVVDGYPCPVDDKYVEDKLAAVARREYVVIETVNWGQEPQQQVVEVPEWQPPSCLAEFVRKTDNLPITVDTRYVQAAEAYDENRTALYMGDRTLGVSGDVKTVVATLKAAGWGT